MGLTPGPPRCVALLLCCCCLLLQTPPLAGAEPSPPHQKARLAAVDLRRFVGCAVREFTFLARKPGCGSLHITTDACWGRCETWEKPVVEPPFLEVHQRVCTYNQTRVGSARLPGCSPGVEPVYSYPVALSCHCSVCLTSTTECLTSA